MEKTSYSEILEMVMKACRENFYHRKYLGEDVVSEDALPKEAVLDAATRIYIEQMKLEHQNKEK